MVKLKVFVDVFVLIVAIYVIVIFGSVLIEYFQREVDSEYNALIIEGSYTVIEEKGNGEPISK